MKILFPTDFSDNSLKALEYAIALSKQLKAQIDLMHVFHLGMEEAGRIHPQRISEEIDKRRNGCIKRLEQLAAQYPNQVNKVRVDYGLFVAQEIIDVARTEGHDFIIMGTKGEHNLMEKILGSVTSTTMMQASCPVIAIPEDCTFKTVKKIAYANDFHPQHAKAVGQLVHFAKALDASIHFVHVNKKENTQQIEDFQLTSGNPFKDFSIVDDDNVVDGLRHFVKSREMDMVALFIPKRRLWERLFHFSISKEMSFQTDHPILVFHE
jgi:nucleotide-binding universal stress UspA family protein